MTTATLDPTTENPPLRMTDDLGPTAWRACLHEAGHALVAAIVRGTDSIESMQVPTGAGEVVFQPDLGLDDRGDPCDEAHIALAGLISEELFFPEEEVFLGAGANIARATETWTDLVTTFCGSAVIGPVLLPDVDSLPDELYDLVWLAVAAETSAAATSVRELLRDRDDQLECLAGAIADAPDRALCGAALHDVLLRAPAAPRIRRRRRR